MVHQHGGRPGSSGRGASGGGASDVGSRNWEIAHGIDAGGSGNKTGGGESDYLGSDVEEIPKPKTEKQPEEKSTEKLFPDFWKLFVNNYEWDLSDVIDIDKPCRDYCYWILTYKNGKKTRISGNVVLEEI